MNKGPFNRLPPIAVDFSGACSVLGLWNVDILLLSPGSCGKVISQVYENRLGMSFLETEFNDIDIAQGITDIVLDNIAEVRDRNKPLVILGTPVMSFVGLDYRQFEHKLRNCLTIELDGYSDYKYGISRALFTVGNALLKQPIKTEKHINIIGYTPLSLGKQSNFQEHISILNRLGYNTSIIGTQKDKFGESLNWVVSEEGIQLAEWMQSHYGVPYILNLPIGLNNSYKWLEELGEILDINVSEEQRNYVLEYSKVIKIDKTIAIIGENYISAKLQECLEKDFGCKAVIIIDYDDEDKVKEIAKYMDICICDAIYATFFEGSHVKVIEVPYMAVGGRTTNSEFKLMGREGYEYLLKHLI
ncbi:MAG: nitrogenase component 1 [Aminipila sp.]